MSQVLPLTAGGVAGMMAALIVHTTQGELLAGVAGVGVALVVAGAWFRSSLPNVNGPPL